MIVLTVYSRPGCHLCDEMIDQLQPLLDGRARLEVVDISEDEELHDRYFLDIPVLMHGQQEISRHRLDQARLVQLLGREGV